ncbi:uncharacterized protein LOC111362457 [Spodoptera litura]|uniref:Uncharacterized protein LOC111362457 n=1 Tax=Spodoptera litura TaxID=69820 RepID=A0A9J7ENN9_SPOLT|nr:uncharacterized protein LOC111362457 [Spodoptera litura]XP_022834896.1 uncharacterized protein LOC111362457 [Spodoptera litura]
MIRRSNINLPAFCVVQFLELPFEAIDDYVCVPRTWLILTNLSKDKSVVAYPNKEDPFVTRERVKNKEKCNHDWKFYMSVVKYETNTFEDAELWIATKINDRPSVKGELKATDIKPRFSLNKKLRAANRNHSSKLNDNPRKPLPRTLIKRPSQSEPNKQLDGKRLKLDDAAQSTSNIVADTNAESGSSRQEQSIITQDNQPIETTETETAVNDTHGTSSSSQQNDENLQESLLIQEQQNSQGINDVPRIVPKNNRQTPTLQVTGERLSLILTKVLNSVRQALLTTQVNHSERAPVNQNHLSEVGNTLQENERMEEETPSAHHGANSDSDTTDHEVTTDDDMSADEAPTERTNYFCSTGITSGSSSAGRSIDVQNSTNHKTQQSRIVLEQQMLDNFAILFTQMGSTLRYTCDMYNTLRSSIHDIAATYKELLGAVEEFNSSRNLPRNSSSLNNRTEVASQFPEERHIEVTASTSSSTQNQQSHGDANRTPKTKHKSWRLVLPPEYDPRDTKWTLKYRTNLPGLVELIPQSGIYVSYGDLKYSQSVSKDCKSLARRLLLAVFNRNALSICLSMTERAQASDNVGSNARPELDDHACTVLLTSVLQQGLQRGWNTDLQPILSTLHNTIKQIRFKYGVTVQC